MNKRIDFGWLSAAGFKGGSAPATARKIAEDRDSTEKHGVEFTEKDKNSAIYTYCFKNGAEFEEFNAGISELRLYDPAHPKGHEYPSAFTAGMAISKKFRHILCKAGRNRREIEKEGFNSQKNGGCNAVRAFSKTLRTQKARYLPFHIGRAFCQPLPGARNLPEEL
ncbi:MAG: hypothetical protein LBU32_27555 [Clostridiales bacterium]|jgi:hypothetical protein|nr:hypothetical protein [Clostridiales bacterium]